MKSLRYACAIGAALALAACGDDNTAEPDTTPTEDTGGSTESDAGTGGDDDSGTGEGGDDATTETPCIYPVPGNSISTGSVMPDIVWTSAFNDAGDEFEFDLYDFYCDEEEYGNYDTLVVVVSAGWCQFCPDMIRWVDALSPRLEEEGAAILFLEAQNSQGGAIGSAEANEHFSQYAENGSGIRVGDDDGGNQIANSNLIQAFPTTFVVRRSDMVVVTDSTRSDYILPFVEIAMDPDADWSNPPPPEIVPDIPANCGPDDEEESEGANNAASGGPVISGPTTISGGICDANPDFYNIDIEGDWTVNLNFSHATGDLDIYLWDVEAEQPVTGEDGSAIGSESTTDNESFSSSGPGVLFVYGYNNATATYELEITTP